MHLFHWLLLTFLLVPLAEIYFLIQIGEIVGAGTTILLVVGTAVLGAWLVRIQGFATVARIQSCLARGEVPALPLMEGALILVAAVLLLTPGFITDSFGFLCLFPPTRRFLVGLGLRNFQVHANPPQPPGSRGDGRIIEGEYRREDPPRDTRLK